jgi:hypothetical protein
MKIRIKNTIAAAFYAILLIGCASDGTSPSGGETSSGGTGSGGSLARFSITNNHLYILSQNALYTYSLADASKPKHESTVPVVGTAETIFSLNNHLLLGTQNGMLIYSLADVAKPSYVSSYIHVRSCDPVVARGDYAYATLRTGTNCFRGVNQLDVINISNVKYPTRANSLSMEKPIGLALSTDYLYVCDNNKIKIYSISNPESPIFLKSHLEFGCFDIIINSDLLIAVTTAGASQFTINSDGSLSKLSTILTE